MEGTIINKRLKSAGKNRVSISTINSSHKFLFPIGSKWISPNAPAQLVPGIRGPYTKRSAEEKHQKKKRALKSANRMKTYYKDLVCKLRKEVVSLKNQVERRCVGNTVRTFKRSFRAKNKSYSDFSLRQKYLLQNTIIELTCPSKQK